MSNHNPGTVFKSSCKLTLEFPILSKDLQYILGIVCLLEASIASCSLVLMKSKFWKPSALAIH